MAVVGLLVNGLSVWILGVKLGDAHDHDHSRNGNEGHHHKHDHDHNLRSAYLHVLADALTSVLAIFALLTGKYLGWNWLDPVMGIVGALLVARWSLGLLRTTSRVLLDRQGPEHLRESIRKCIGDLGDEVVDLHLWAIAPNRYSLALSVVADQPKPLANYRNALLSDARLAHMTVEVWEKKEVYSEATESAQPEQSIRPM